MAERYTAEDRKVQQVLRDVTIDLFETARIVGTVQSRKNDLEIEVQRLYALIDGLSYVALRSDDTSKSDDWVKADEYFARKSE